jgi:hypothetical protein
LISGFATDFATPGRMYIPAFSIWTYSDVGKRVSYHDIFLTIIGEKELKTP